MNFDKYTDRSRGFVQSAQSLALREGHQQFAPEHLLKVLLDDPEGLAAGLIDRSGGDSREALAAVEAALAKRPKCRAAAPGRSISIRRWRECSTPPRRRARSRRQLRHRRALVARARIDAAARPARLFAKAGVTPQKLNAAIEALRKGRRRQLGLGRKRL